MSEEVVQKLEEARVEGYIDKREVARRIGRTVRTVDTMMAKGLLPYYKLGKTVAFKWSEVDAHIRGAESVLSAARVSRSAFFESEPLDGQSW